MTKTRASAFEIRQPFQRRQAWHEEILAAAQHVEPLHAVNTAPDRLSGNRKRCAFLLKSDYRVSVPAQTHEVTVVDPLPLQEFQSRHCLGADEQEMEPSRNFVIALRKRVRVVW